MIDETVATPAPALRKSAVAKPAKKAAKGKGRKANGKVHGKASTKPVKRGSGLRIRELLAKGKETDEILAIIHKEFPDSVAKAGDVSWNRGYAARMKAAKKTSKKK